MSDKAEKIKEKRGSIEIDIDIQNLLPEFISNKTNGKMFIILNKLFNGFLALFFLPLYPFKKMVEYSNEELEE